MDKNIEIGARLKEFAKNNFPSIAEFSRRMGMKQRQDIYIYFKGKSLLGSEKLSILSNLGCNIEWLLNGNITKNDNIKEPVSNYQNYSDNLTEARISKLEKELLLLKYNNLELENAKLKEELAAMNDKIVQLSAQLTLLGELNKKVMK